MEGTGSVACLFSSIEPLTLCLYTLALLQLLQGTTCSGETELQVTPQFMYCFFT
jgi:hypothetical protein